MSPPRIIFFIFETDTSDAFRKLDPDEKNGWAPGIENGNNNINNNQIDNTPDDSFSYDEIVPPHKRADLAGQNKLQLFLNFFWQGNERIYFWFF